MIIHIMHEVKVREEEYEFVKELSHQIEGLLPSVQLARRERRLLWHGDMTYTRGHNTSLPKGYQSSVLSPPSSNRTGSQRTPAIVLSPCPESPAINGRKSRSSTKTNEKPANIRPSAVQVSVFTDILLLAEHTVKSSSAADSYSYRLVHDVGIAKILGVNPKYGSGEQDAHFTVLSR